MANKEEGRAWNMDDFALYTMLSLIVPIIVLLTIIMYKMIVGEAIPNSDYTPIDHITGNTPIEFHEEKQEKEEKDEQGDDKDKNIRKAPY
ncbi:Protein of unknown function [Paenibacillus tianmuensis]|uniref:DUF3951 domain-containing protein n=1 Tax=Paenibacillus tianmuensis TaxID=624147 RepID=A0A1G4SWM0_9BACL|nr:DUF3951 domain-containing protein [Paenibacillus tianmuensis]SCW72679.1 Protein of unknown function [Paenibacillus tianmuensis]